MTSGGPLYPSFPPFPVTGAVFPNFHVGAGTGSKHDGGLGFGASLAASGIWAIRFQLPPVLPTGTPRLRGYALANATTGAAKLHPLWAQVAPEEDPSSAALSSEGVQTITWGTGDNDQYKLFEVTLTAAGTLVPLRVIVMRFIGEPTGWTLAQVMTLCHLHIYWS